MIDILFAVFAFVLMISIIVTVHEYGHYIAGRWFGLIGTHFSIGFGKKILGWTDKRGTEWRIAPFLIGGYVRFPGDDNQELKPGQKKLNDLKRWQRAIVVGAGPGINLILAGLLFAVIAYAYGYPAGRPVVTALIPGSPAVSAGLQPGDTITRFDGADIVLAADVRQRAMLLPNRTVTIDFQRGNEALQTEATLAARPYDDGLGNQGVIGFLGVELPNEYEKSPTIGHALTKGVSDGVFTTYAQFMSLKQIITGERSVTELSGPVRIAKMSAHTLSLGLLPFLYLMALLSIAVGMMNLLPIPGLDGGHLATYAVEGILRRDIPESVSQTLIRVGFTAIALLGIFAISLDVLALS